MFDWFLTTAKRNFLKWPDSLHCAALMLMLFTVAASGQFKDELLNYKNWNRFNEINEFYQLNQYGFAWIGKKAIQTELIAIIRSADSLGLDKEDYQYSSLISYNEGNLVDRGDSIDADVRFTDGAIHFFTELSYGNKIPSFGYAGLKYSPSKNNKIVPLLSMYMSHDSIKNLLSVLDLKSAEYRSVISKLNWFQLITREPDFKDAKISSKNVDETNKALLLRLYQLGITDSILKKVEKKVLLKQVKKAQVLFDMLNDGVLRGTSLNAFNTPLKQRIEELKTALNYLRWTERIKQTASVLILNIPSTYLMVYEKGKIVLDSKVIVGKPSTPTPTVTSTISQVILYPFWNVPYKIATKELLPSIKRDRGFLEAGNYQVLNNEGRVLDPYRIDWGGLSATNFPYHIRQCTGCDNALGIVKFEFYNPFTVYLHDTPNKGLFAFNKRYFSHGCMRVEKPVELAHLLLGANRIAIDTLTAKGCLYQKAPVPLAVEHELPVIIMYSTAWYNKEGEVRFYDDVYEKLNR